MEITVDRNVEKTRALSTPPESPLAEKNATPVIVNRINTPINPSVTVLACSIRLTKPVMFPGYAKYELMFYTPYTILLLI